MYLLSYLAIRAGLVNSLPLAQMAGSYSIAQMVLFAIVAIGVVSILLVFCRARGIQIPPEFITYALIVLAVIGAIFAIKIILSM